MHSFPQNVDVVVLQDADFVVIEVSSLVQDPFELLAKLAHLSHQAETFRLLLSSECIYLVAKDAELMAIICKMFPIGRHTAGPSLMACLLLVSVLLGHFFPEEGEFGKEPMIENAGHQLGNLVELLTVKELLNGSYAVVEGLEGNKDGKLILLDDLAGEKDSVGRGDHLVNVLDEELETFRIRIELGVGPELVVFDGLSPFPKPD